MLSDIRKAIKMLRGVASVKLAKDRNRPNKETIEAMQEIQEGKSIKCKTFSEYKNLVTY